MFYYLFRRDKDRNKDKDKEFDLTRVKVKEEPLDGTWIVFVSILISRYIIFPSLLFLYLRTWLYDSFV